MTDIHVETEEAPVPETRELTYDGLVDPAIGSLMGRGMNDKIWTVLGCVYDPVKNQTKVSVEEFIQQ